MKTIRVRIAVAVSPNGCWSSNGGQLLPGDPALWTNDAIAATGSCTYLFKAQGVGHVVFIEADVPVPEPQTIEGTVTP